MNAARSIRNRVYVIGKLVFGLLLLFMLILICAFVFRDTILRLTTSKILDPYGIRITEIQGLKLTTSSLSIQSARFRTDETSEDNELQNLSVTFSLKDLVKGRVKHIEVVSLKLFSISIDMPEDAASETTPDHGIDLGKVVATLQSIPIDSVVVERLDVVPLNAVFLLSLDTNTREINADIISDLTAITARINWHDTDFVSSYFIPDEQLVGHDFSAQALTGSLQIVDQQALATRFEFTLSDAGERRLLLDAAGELQLASFMPLVYRYGLAEDTGQNLAGALYFSASFQEDSASIDEQRLNTVITLREDSFVTAKIPTFPNDPNASFQWHATQPISFSGTFEPVSTALELSVSAQQMVASLQTQSGDRQATLDISQLTLNCSDSTHCGGHQETSIRLPAMSINDFQVQNISAVTSSDFSYNNGNLQWHFDQGSRIGADSVTGPNIALTDANILVQESVNLTLDENTLAITSDGVELYLPTLRTGEKTAQGAFKLSQLELRRNSDDASFQGTMLLEARNLASDLLPFVLRKPEFSSMLTVAGSKVDAEGAIKAADRAIFTFHLTHDLNTATGQGQFTVPRQQFGEGQDSLAHLFFSFPYEADVIHGTVEANADLQWQTGEMDTMQIAGPLRLAIVELSGFFEDVAVLNLTTTVEGQLSDTINFVSSPNLHLEIGSFDPGLPITDIKLDYSVNTSTQTAEIRNASAGIFDGTVQSSDLHYNWLADENLVDVDITRIDLSKVLSMGSYDGVQATGFISGHLPIRIAGSNVSINGGSLHVEPPGGAIRYLSGNTNSGNPALDLVNQALSNYQYGVMDTDVSYAPNGDLSLGIKLQGRNPDMNAGQKINLNLNVSDNIPDLLESLQASRNVTDALERELQNR